VEDGLFEGEEAVLHVIERIVAPLWGATLAGPGGYYGGPTGGKGAERMTDGRTWGFGGTMAFESSVSSDARMQILETLQGMGAASLEVGEVVFQFPISANTEDEAREKGVRRVYEAVEASVRWNQVRWIRQGVWGAN
jgi:hypothetical protein